MILDVMEHARRYMSLNQGFAKAMAFLRRPELKALPVGRYAIDGERVYALVSREPGRRKEDERLEVHDRYIDVQLVLAGTDEMGWRPRSTCTQPAGPYNPATDAQCFSDPAEAWIAVKSGAFVIFFPEDAHLPGISPGLLHKCVVKVAVEG
jgi:YhcH/YjgK/YiaL family protein